MAIIEVEHVTKVFRPRLHTRAFLAHGGWLAWLRGRRRQRFTALEDVSFSVKQGETVGIIGANGSGKSTLLKLIAGVSAPTAGTVRVYGRVASLLELGAGFHPILTGRENIYLNGALLGMSRRDIDAAFDAIASFSGVSGFLDQPVETYSSGMYVRLGFSVAVHANPDVFLVDEVLAVGDEAFQRKCRTRIGELREQGKTILFVSHDLGLVSALCERVLLLSGGRLIVRTSAQATIDYYLRQAGHDRGRHTFSGGRVEAVFNNGRLSLFFRGREVTAPTGLQVLLEYMEQFHNAIEADWEVTERRPNGCSARGPMPRMPVVQYWTLEIKDGRLFWAFEIECLQDFDLGGIRANLFFPGRYARWMYGLDTGVFPEIQPGDLQWRAQADPEAAATEAAALPKAGDADTPLVYAALKPRQPFVRLTWWNTDYMAGCRVLQVEGKIPGTLRPLRAGRLRLFELEVEPGITRNEFAARISRLEELGAVKSGPLEGRFRQGSLRIFLDGQLVSAPPHFYTSMLIGNLWNDSMHLHWSAPVRTAQGLSFTGASRRFAYRLTWELWPTENGIGVRVWLDADEPLEPQEYHASVALLPAYSDWETDHEFGQFPPFDPNSQRWIHINRDYRPGGAATARGDGMPGITLSATAEAVPFRFTVINTTPAMNARVLQALRTPEAGLLYFEPGRHLYFEGMISALPPDAG